MILEVCTEGVPMSLDAAKAGASRLELCSAISEGGLTPSIGTIQQVCYHANIPVHVMIRPRAGDFHYDESEFETMLADVRLAAKMGAKGVVFGILTSDGEVDVERCKRLVYESNGMTTVFHRAFDMAADPYRALDDLQSIGINVLLTSGRRHKAIDGIEVIRQLASRANPSMQIMAGSGVNPGNASRLASTGIKALHFTCQKPTPGKMLYQNHELESMGSSTRDEYEIAVFDFEKFNAIKDVASNL